MLAFLDASGTAGGIDTVGPLTSGVSFTMSTGALTATVSDATTGNANVTAAEYFIDVAGSAGSGTPMAGAFASPTEAVSATIPAATITSLASGTHSIYIRGRDALSNWGSLGSTTFTVDTTGPTTSALTLAPNPSNGSVAVTLGGTASDASSGNGNVVAAEYFIGAPGANGTGSIVTRNVTAPTVSLSATITAPGASGVVSVHAQDAAGNWGPYATINLTVDAGGPATSGVNAQPPANNGSYGQSSSQASVRVNATISDTASGNQAIAAGEGFIDSVGATGTGFPFTALDSTFNSPTESVFASIPLSTINLLANGNHTIYVRGRDAGGSWGATASLTYLIDRTAPTFTGATRVAVNPTLGGGITVTVTGATDPLVAGLASGVAGGEYWIDTAAPAPGGGTPFTGTGPFTIGTTLATGNHTVGLRVRDVAGNWSADTSTGTVATAVVAIFSNGFDTGFRPWGWSWPPRTPRPGSTSPRRRPCPAPGASKPRATTRTMSSPTSGPRPTRPGRPMTPGSSSGRTATLSTGQDILVAASNTNYAAANIRARVRYRLNGDHAAGPDPGGLRKHERRMGQPCRRHQHHRDRVPGRGERRRGAGHPQPVPQRGRRPGTDPDRREHGQRDHRSPGLGDQWRQRDPRVL